MKKVVLGTLLIALAGSTAAFAQGGAATGAATGAVGGAIVGGPAGAVVAQLSVQPPAELLMNLARAFALM